jgi:hypothetical protein
MRLAGNSLIKEKFHRRQAPSSQGREGSKLKDRSSSLSLRLAASREKILKKDSREAAKRKVLRLNNSLSPLSLALLAF